MASLTDSFAIVAGLLPLDPCLPLGILALTKISLIYFGFLKVTIMSSLINGLVVLGLSIIDQYLDKISFNGGFLLLYVVISMRGFSSFPH